MPWLAPIRSPCDPWLLSAARQLGAAKMVVAGADQRNTLEGVRAGIEAGLLDPVLIGARSKISDLANELGWQLPDLEMVDAGTEPAIAEALIDRVSQSDVMGVIKGQIHTDIFMAALLSKAAGLRTGQRFTHHFRMGLAGVKTPLFISDAALNILPDISTKKIIIQNSIKLAKACGIARPQVALLSATETPTAAMNSSVEAAQLTEWARDNIDDADVHGPLAFDNAVSAASAALKGIVGPVAGCADTLIVPSIEVGNVLFKALTYMLGANPAGIVLGARVPIILTSRSDDAEARLASMAMSRIMAASNI